MPLLGPMGSLSSSFIPAGRLGTAPHDRGALPLLRRAGTLSASGLPWVRRGVLDLPPVRSPPALLRGTMPDQGADGPTAGRQPAPPAKRRRAARPPRPPKSLPEAPQRTDQRTGLGCANRSKNARRTSYLLILMDLAALGGQSQRQPLLSSISWKVTLTPHYLCSSQSPPPDSPAGGRAE